MKKGGKIDQNRTHPHVYVYKISCNDPAVLDFYIGSTVNIIGRTACHRTKCSKNSKVRLYEFINYNGGWDNWSVDVIEEFKNISLKQKKEIEKKYLEVYKPRLNKVVIGRTVKQYQRDNKEKLALYAKTLRLKNLEKNREYLRNRYHQNIEKYRASARRSYSKHKETITKNRHHIYKCLCGAEVKNYRRNECINSKGHSERLKKIFQDIKCIK